MRLSDIIHILRTYYEVTFNTEQLSNTECPVRLFHL